jgi:hypothetical protein
MGKIKLGAVGGILLANSLILTIATPVAAGADDHPGASVLHTAFAFWTHPLQGSEGDIYYTENLKHMMTVTTPFARWSCSRGPVIVDGSGDWRGGFVCADGQGDLTVLVAVNCAPNKIVPMNVQMMSVYEKGRDGHDIGIQFVAACSTGTTVPKGGEVTR